MSGAPGRPSNASVTQMPPEEWSELYPSFAEFLAAYLEGEGRLK
jgi:hypothetical protein